MIFLSYDKGESKDMKKKNMIIIGVIALILVITIGYALFSDTLTINGTATAKGDFNMTMTCQPGLDTSIASAEDIMMDEDNGYENDQCSVDDKTMTFSTGLKYPGAQRSFTVKMKNEGSIDAYLNVDTGLTSNVKTCYDANANDTFEESECVNDSVPYVFEISVAPIGYEKSDGTKFNFWTGSEDQISEITSEDGNSIIVKPGDTLYVLISPYFNKLVTGSGNFNYKIEGTYQFNFTQKQ